MEWGEGGKWDNSNSIINKYIFFLIVVVLLVMGAGKVYLPIPPSWPEVSPQNTRLLITG